jgi:hypothetical protein
LATWRRGAIEGAVSCRNRSSAAAIAAACSGLAAGAITWIAGLRGRLLPLVVMLESLGGNGFRGYAPPKVLCFAPSALALN